ncbi:PREDICTED: uncharacterized protein LOC104810372 [Tarenaya hassleriana]|uniref:uncharacterized protein LOC104810372 n=1 Tax=Tarenaya hassleriana TaxID=28532 RepID=UPI00053C73D9|nr:PREDICTED: uncharacterized protein LOC104810372 [Tarenaya hassleriana]
MSGATTMMAESKPEIEMAECECCGLTEEYTTAYIDNVRTIYAGKWICGLCSEAVNYGGGVAGVEEALAGHMRFCGEFRSSPPTNVDVISALMQLFRRKILGPPRKARSAPASSANSGGGGPPCSAVLVQTGSCLPTLSGGA